jgi:hypothetical protein
LANIVATKVGMTATVGTRAPAFKGGIALPLYRFHLYNTEETQDLEGRDFPNLEAAHADAIKSARSIMAEDITSIGEITLSHWIELETEDGDMHVVTFGDAVTINP